MGIKLPSPKSEGCETLALHLRAEGIAFKREVRFAKPRKWRFDFILLMRGVAVEVDGGLWVQGRHSRGAGMEKDFEKLNEAAILGWHVLRFSTEMVKDGTAIATIKRALA